jgi:hypothetical protein
MPTPIQSDAIKLQRDRFCNVLSRSTKKKPQQPDWGREIKENSMHERN